MTLRLDEDQFRVGSIVYFIAAKSQNVIPGLVCEKIVRTSIDGSSRVNYVLEVRVTEGMKKVEVDPQKSQLFSSPDTIETFLIERAVAQIKEIVQEAVTRAEIFSSRITEEPSAKDIPLPTDIDEMQSSIPQLSDTVVDLGDGTVARLKI
jgi:hypothetical protein